MQSNGQLVNQQDRIRRVPDSNSEAAQGFTAERVLRTRPKTYRAIVQLLADPHASVNQIAKLHRVSTHTVRAIRHREAQDIAERKKTLAAMLANVAELGASRMEETIGRAGLRDAAIATGIAADKMVALTGQLPLVQIANVILPTPEQDAQRAALHAKLDAFTKLLHAHRQDAS
jgi:transposase-like protein